MGIRSPTRDLQCSVSLRSSPSLRPQPGQSSPVMTGCLLNNKPPDSGERLTPHRGAPSVWGSKPALPQSGSASHTRQPWGSKGGHTPLPPCDLHTLPGHNCRRPGQQTPRGGGFLLICPYSSCITVLLHPPIPAPGLPLGFPCGSAGKESACNAGDRV